MIKHRHLLTFLGLTCLGHGACAQESKPDSSNTTTGTIIFVLANPLGFVIAGDSRRSAAQGVWFFCKGQMQTYCDDSQKIFRTGNKTAVAIAGFASTPPTQTPVDFDVASVLRARFPDSSPYYGDGTFESTVDWMEMAFRAELPILGSIFCPDAEKCAFSTLVAGVAKTGNPIMQELDFDSKPLITGPFNQAVADFSLNQHAPIHVKEFETLVVGEPRAKAVVEKILAGDFSTKDRTILAYYRRRKTSTSAAMPLEEMKALAAKLLHEAHTASLSVVGGDDQIGIFPVIGKTNLQLPVAALSTTKQPLSRLSFSRGLLYAPGHLGDAAVIKGTGRESEFEDFQQPLEAPAIRVYVANKFENVTVSLDGNIFVKNLFSSVRFRFQGGWFGSSGDQIQGPCVFEVPLSLDLPSGIVPSQCQIDRKSEFGAKDDRTVGMPVRLQVSGCYKKEPNGTITFTAGQTKDKNCGNVAGVSIPPH